jgi:hypothetical protein
MLTCKQASRLVSERQDRKLNWHERVGLRLHLWICNNCQRFEKQIRYIQQAVRKGQLEGQLPVEKSLPPESVERIRKALHDRKEGQSD